MDKPRKDSFFDDDDDFYYKKSEPVEIPPLTEEHEIRPPSLKFSDYSDDFEDVGDDDDDDEEAEKPQSERYYEPTPRRSTPISSRKAPVAPKAKHSLSPPPSIRRITPPPK